MMRGGAAGEFRGRSDTNGLLSSDPLKREYNLPVIYNSHTRKITSWKQNMDNSFELQQTTTKYTNWDRITYFMCLVLFRKLTKFLCFILMSYIVIFRTNTFEFDVFVACDSKDFLFLFST